MSHLLWNLCEVRVSLDKRYSITQHIKTEKYLKSVNLCQNKKQNVQSLFTYTTTLNKITFSADIYIQSTGFGKYAAKNLNNKHFKSFLDKYTTKIIPNKSTIRKNYLHDVTIAICYIDTMNKIRNKIEGKKYVVVCRRN